MARVLIAGELGLGLAGWCATAADDPSKELTPPQRGELAARWQELNAAGSQHYDAGNLPAAVKVWEQALATARRLYAGQDHANLATSLSNLGWVYEKRGGHAEAEPLCRAALEMRRRLHKGEGHADTARSLNELAYVLQDQGQSRDAELLYREALAMRRRLHRNQDHIDVAQSLNNLAYTVRSQGNYAEAETHYRAALEMVRRLAPGQDRPHVALCLNNLAAVLQDRGRYADAEALHREALEMRRRLYRGQDQPPLATSLNNVGSVLKFQGKYAEAEPFVRAALAMRDRLYRERDHSERSQSMNNLAGLLLAQEKYPDAEGLYRQALAMNRRLYAGQDRIPVAVALNNLAHVLHDRGRYADGEALYREALAMFRRIHGKPHHADVARALNNLASILADQGKHTEADPFYREALAVHRVLAEECAAVQSEGEALTLAATYPRTRDSYLSSAAALRADAASVYAQLWASKAALTRLYERRALAARAATADPEVAALLTDLTDQRRRRADVLLAPKPADPASRKQRNAVLAQYAGAITQVERTLRSRLPAVARAERLAKAVPADLQERLPADVAVVDCLRWTRFEQDPRVPGKKGQRHTDRYLAFVVTRDRIAWVDLAEAEPIARAVTAWREAITGGQDIPARLPAEVRRLVWAKVRRELPAQVKQVYLCPDLALCRVPWAALPGDRPNSVLLEDYAVAVIPHAVFLLDQLWPEGPRPRRAAGVLAVGGVAYDGALPAAGHSVLNRGAPPAKSGQPSRWPALPGAAAEVRGVRGAARKKGLACRVLDREGATAPAVLAALPRARYAHLATHGFFADASFRSAFQVDPRLFAMTQQGERIGAGALSPMVMTGLVFAGANDPRTPGRGIVTGEGLVDLDLSALDLAVLSACETGLGDVAGGEGTFGLQRAFHLAGTRDVIASLWQVPDRPTAALMGLFYHNLWDKQQPPAEALRQAQLEIYRHPERIAALAEDFRGKFAQVPGSQEAPAVDGKAHPRLWAAFTLSGPGR
jgi:CHAT domain-containing protein/tetratricopeptide (TPR) repeat protein